MASNPPGECCFKAVLHDKVIVILTDIYGYGFKNTQLIADQLAKRTGYYVVVPDILKGEALVFGKVTPEIFGDWFSRHPIQGTKDIVTDFLTNLKKELNPDYLCGIGYCFGAKYLFHQMTADGLFDVGVGAHPSFADDDEVSAIRKPVLISAAEKDNIFTAELRHKTESILSSIEGLRYQIDLFGGVEHGFTIRSDENIPAVRYAKNKALIDHVYWFKEFEPTK
ncbi:hypothetical protein B5S28_g1739 [[Candida] boidinii]|nr:hypothetical protein B5S28_g1739 [[Candida] boidinii]OWB60781.1 hypothetical protein B5S29_g1662 [[Candida] boidinii]